MSENIERREYMTPGLNPPISHYCDAVSFCVKAFGRRPSATPEPARTGRHPKAFTQADFGSSPGTGHPKTEAEASAVDLLPTHQPPVFGLPTLWLAGAGWYDSVAAHPGQLCR